MSGFEDRVDHFDRFAQTAWEQELQGRLMEIVSPEPGERCLEVACGPGRLTCRLAAAFLEVVGFDQSPAMIERARQNAAACPNARFEVGDVLALPDHLRRAFDVALAVRLIFFLPDPAAGVRALAAAVRPGGRIVFLNPSEALNEESAAAYCQRHRIAGFDRDCLSGWAGVAAAHPPQTEAGTLGLLTAAGIADPVVVPVLDGLAWIAHGRRGA